MKYKFRCEQCYWSENDYKNSESYTREFWIKENRVWEKFKYQYILSKCCKKQFSIDYLTLHNTRTLLHSR